MKAWSLVLLAALGTGQGAMADGCPPELFSNVAAYEKEPLLLSDDALKEIAFRMNGYEIKAGVIHYWRYPGTEDAFMYARGNAMATWLGVRLILEKLQEQANGLSVEEQLERGYALPFFKPEFEDVVNGDPHFGNIGLIPLSGRQAKGRQIQGRRLEGRLLSDELLDGQGLRGHRLYEYRVHIVYNDVDDAGLGPLIGDVIRNAATSAWAGVPIGPSLRGYLTGLGRGPIIMPKWVQPYSDMPIEFFEKLQMERTAKMFRKGKFRKSGGDINYDLPEDIIHHITHLFNVVQYPDTRKPIIATYTKPEGGSGKIPRYWALREFPEGFIAVSELKWISREPAVMGLRPEQPSQGYRFDIGISQMWHSRNHDVYRVDLKGEPYFVRPRYVNPMKKTVESFEYGSPEITEWAEFSAALLGENHDSSPRDAHNQLRDFISGHPEGFLRSSVQMVRMINTLFSVAREHHLHGPAGL